MKLKNGFKAIVIILIKVKQVINGRIYLTPKVDHAANTHPG